MELSSFGSLSSSKMFFFVRSQLESIQKKNLFIHWPCTRLAIIKRSGDLFSIFLGWSFINFKIITTQQNVIVQSWKINMGTVSTVMQSSKHWWSVNSLWFLGGCLMCVRFCTVLRWRFKFDRGYVLVFLAFPKMVC